jgi:hypothetical protein
MNAYSSTSRTSTRTDAIFKPCRSQPSVGTGSKPRDDESLDQPRRCLSPVSSGVLRDAQPENAGLDQPADIAERAATFEPAGRPACGIETVDWRAIWPLDAAAAGTPLGSIEPLF